MRNNWKDKLNILIIMTDQHHSGVMGCAGDPVASTPSLDGLSGAGFGSRMHTAHFPFAAPAACPS